MSPTGIDGMGLRLLPVCFPASYLIIQTHNNKERRESARGRVGSIFRPSTLPTKRWFMTDLSTFAITRKWPARHPDRLQLYSLPTPNGVKVSIMLEETGLPYE